VQLSLHDLQIAAPRDGFPFAAPFSGHFSHRKARDRMLRDFALQPALSPASVKFE
jgi:hypothetical protein